VLSGFFDGYTALHHPRDPSCSMDPHRWSSLLLGSFFHYPNSGLAEILACFFPLVLWGPVGRFLFELISLPLCFVGFCSFL
jgi:hypothetical protein